MQPKLVCLMLEMLMMMPATVAAFEDLPPPPAGGGTMGLYLDNDVFGGEDRDYTNGVRWTWLSQKRGLSDSISLDSVCRMLEWGLPDSSHEVVHSYGFSLTQLMFTPDDHSSNTQPEGERRYAGWLGLGVSLHARSPEVLNSLEFTLGTTGENSLADSSQKFMHDLINSNEFRGWENQVPNEVTADLSFNRKQLFDLSAANSENPGMVGKWEWGLRLGTFRTKVHLGAELRYGFNLSPDFSDLRLSDTAYRHPALVDGHSTGSDWSAYLIGGAKVHGIAHDATLDGPLFRNFETGNSREPFVVEVSVGFGLKFHEVELSYIHTLRTAEYEEQDGLSEFGSIGLGFKF